MTENSKFRFNEQSLTHSLNYASQCPPSLLVMMTPTFVPTHTVWERRVRQNSQTRFLSGIALTRYDCDLFVVHVESGVRVQGVREVHECVHSGKSWMHIALTNDSSKSQKLNAESLSILEPWALMA